MPPTWSLSSGICSLFLSSGEADAQTSPVLQVVEIKLQKGRDGVKRFRILLSDGGSMIYGLCTGEVGEDILDNKIEKGCVLQLLGFFVTTAVNGKPVLVVTETILRHPPLSIVGNPLNPFVDPASIGAYPAVKAAPQRAKDFTTKISKLEPGGKYCIEGEITSRIPLRTWSNSRGEGVYFWVEISDGSGAVRGTFFREIASKWDGLVKEGKVYSFTGCHTKSTDRNYAADVMSDVEVVLSKETVIREIGVGAGVEVLSDKGAVPISALVSLVNGTKVDVVGVLSSVSPVTEIRTKSNDELSKRTLHLTDRSGTVEVVLWATDAQEFSIPTSTPIRAKDMKLGEFNNTPNLSYTRTSSITVDESPEGVALREWWAAPK